jgi:soluble lytic murein transglycosylase-like protein
MILLILALRLVWPSDVPQHLVEAQLAAQIYNVPVRVVIAISWHESRWMPTKVNKVGRCGVMQVTDSLSPFTCKQLTDPFIGYLEGARFMKYWIDRAGGDLRHGLDAYACGNTGLTSGCLGFGPAMIGLAHRIERAERLLQGDS